MKFFSPFEFGYPSLEGYEAEKSLSIIKTESEPLKSCVLSMPPMLLGNDGNEKLCQRWEEYYSLRLATAARGVRKTYVSFFPGHTVPGPGTGESTCYRGSLAIERFEHLLSLSGGLPPIAHFTYRYSKPRHTISDVPPVVDWPWGVKQPKLKLLRPAQDEHVATPDERGTLMNWLKQQVEHFFGRDQVPVLELLSLIRSAWSPYTKPPVFEQETLLAGHHIISEFKEHGKKELCDWLALAFELEACLSHLQYSQSLNISSYGEYNGCWIEVGMLPISTIRCTELVVVERVLSELASLCTRGFASIIINEFGCDTDGTHRLVAAWMWNILEFLCRMDERMFVFFALDHFHLKEMVRWYFTLHADEMGPVVVREVLRALTEILNNEAMRTMVIREILPHTRRAFPVTHLPVLLLPEYSCGAVIKGPYDEGVASYRVDPTVYEQLAENPSCVLPARGPYHLTDRVMLPWFRMLKNRK